jgi:hypothetical protein
MRWDRPPRIVSSVRNCARVARSCKWAPDITPLLPAVSVRAHGGCTFKIPQRSRALTRERRGESQRQAPCSSGGRTLSSRINPMTLNLSCWRSLGPKSSLTVPCEFAPGRGNAALAGPPPCMASR